MLKETVKNIKEEKINSGTVYAQTQTVIYDSGEGSIKTIK